MTVTFLETAKIMRRINAHHGNAPITDEQVKIFREELAPTMTFGEANAAVGEYYSSHDGGSWMGVGDVNRLVRARRRSMLPSERELDEMAVREGLDGDGAWVFRRALVRSVSAGRPAGESFRLALEAARRPMLGAVPSGGAGPVSGARDQKTSETPLESPEKQNAHTPRL
ncbi:hypothetical protein [Bifidobacterium bifidum]|uniref:Uncharacterized protein n=1 Tax=Bifidobacterium bifidum TaxID=1681 RepID=A0A415C372_BIFBI|nr:hypothetical protein [Bifidobacterium bifidum]RGK02389.1 hypothetical protein DXD34_09690 [Bifidobacterium bifidum]RHJ03147.1 hypothetical protein DW145_09470 [Bifidobacterium bifidum]RHJ22099.1 hypothetical protein DW137_09770 [Bifidobacterium bifidum]